MKTITTLIREVLEKRGSNPSKLAVMVSPPTTPQNMNRRLSRDNMEIAWIERISVALNHDFFADLSREFQENARRKSFEVDNVVNEPEGIYVVDAKLAGAIRKVVQEEIKKAKK